MFTIPLYFSIVLEKISLDLFSTRSKRGITHIQDSSNEEKEGDINSEKRKKILPFQDTESDDIIPVSHSKSTRSTILTSSSSTTTSTSTRPTTATPMTTLQALMEEDQLRKQRQNILSNQRTGNQKSTESEENENERYQSWLHPNIVVKILNKRLCNGKYYKAKGVVESITGGGYIGEIRILEIRQENENSTSSKKNEIERIRVDQEELETVIPQVKFIHTFVNLISEQIFLIYTYYDRLEEK